MPLLGRFKPSSLSSLRLVFVYGTLRSGESRDINLLRPAPRLVGQGSLPGVLYDLGAYPGMRLVAGRGDVVQGEVYGEVYGISAELERQLDEIEEVWPQQSGEYAKREVLLRLDQLSLHPAFFNFCEGLAQVSCLVYEIGPEHTRGRPVIASGDWIQHRKTKAS